MSTPELPQRLRYRVSDRSVIDDAFRREAAGLAQRTTQKNAARVYGVSFTAIRKWMQGLGLKSRRPCAPTIQEINTMGSAWIRPDSAPIFRTPRYCQSESAMG